MPNPIHQAQRGLRAAVLSREFAPRLGGSAALSSGVVPVVLLLILTAIGRLGAQVPAGSPAELLFVRRVSPLLAQRCLACHGQDAAQIKGGLDLRSRQGLLKGGESGQASLHPKHPLQSPLWLAASRQHEEQWSAMPPKQADALKPEELSWLEQWLKAGAPWPEAERAQALAKAHEQAWSQEDGVRVKTLGGLSAAWRERKYALDALWAYQPLRAAKPAELAAAAHPVDALLHLHWPKGLQPAPEASPEAFIRRACFDLTGLPPSPQEVEAFLKQVAGKGLGSETGQQAIAALIERLLASPHYGERMAQHWLDVVRYADSSGFANDYERGNAWRYRDYVVRAFNADKPWADFVIEQIAGDELDGSNSQNLVATGFLRMGPWELTGMEVERVARQRFLDDVTNSVGETFLGHALQCARCHDHKFDPVPTADYYSIAAVFATTQLAEAQAPFTAVENTQGFEERRFLELRAREHQQTLSQLDALLLQNAQAWFKAQGRDPKRWNEAVAAVRAQGGKGKGRPAFAQFSDVFDAARRKLLQAAVPEQEFPPKLLGFGSREFGMERVARKGLERLRFEWERYEPVALSVYSGLTRTLKTVTSPLRVPQDRLSSGELEKTCIRSAGDPFAEGPAVKPGVLSVLGLRGAAPIPDGVEGRRLALARWVAAADNPLSWRSIANRLWLWHFGRGIAGNPNNFGATGKRPTHPELLDFLALHLQGQGGSIKAMHRLLMTSAAYRRSAIHPDPAALAKLDPQGVSGAVFALRRLSAEELRDAMLWASGELNPQLGGIPNRPEIHEEVALQPRQVMGTFAAAWVPNPKPQQRHRRSLYALKWRGLGDPSMEVFNAPPPDFSCEQRESSSVTPQVFALFNSKASSARALAMAARVLRETKDDEAALQRCFVLAYSRRPTADERIAARQHWMDMLKLQPAQAAIPPSPPLQVKREAVEENTGEKFVFTETLHAHAQFVPDLGPHQVPARTRALAAVCLALFNSNEFVHVE